MPWRFEPKKGAASGETPRGAASRRRSGDTRMGEPAGGNAPASLSESIGQGRGPGELKHLSSPRKRKKQSKPQVAASEKGRAQTQPVQKPAGVAGWG